MTRYRWIAVLAIVVVPAVAYACWPGRGGSRVVYAEPVYPLYAPPPVYVGTPVWQPAPQYVMPPPRIEPIPKMATPSPAPPSGMGTVAPPPSAPPRAPAVEPIRPVVGSDIPMSPPKADPPRRVDPPAVVPDPLPKFPAVEVPKEQGPLPKLILPTEPDFRPSPAPKTPLTETPKTPAPAPVLPDLKLPALPGASAVPSPAPAMPEPLIPSPSLPALPDLAKPELPSLSLPPETPVAPAKLDSTSRSSPLAGAGSEPTVKVLPVAGPVDLTGYKAVSFYNHTDRELTLNIEGQAVKLPAKTYRNTRLGPTFTWGYANGTAVRETVPAGTAGLDVVFRE